MDIKDTFNRAVLLAQNNDKAQARQLLIQILRQEPRYAQAWLWLSATVEADAERRACLERVLIIDPHNQVAQKGVAMLNSRKVEPNQPTAQAQENQCPSCGKINRIDAVFCRECGTQLAVQTNAMPPNSPTDAPLIEQFDQVGTAINLDQDTHEEASLPRQRCPSCGFENSAEAQFCGMCGQGLLKSMPLVSKASPESKPKPDIQPSLSRPSSPAFLWRLPGIVGIGLVLLAGILPWGEARWLFSSRMYTGLENEYGVWSTGLAVLALILFLSIRHHIAAHLIALLPVGGAVIAAVGAMNDVAGVTTSRSLIQNLSVGPYGVLLGGALVGISFILSLIVKGKPANPQKRGVDNQQAQVDKSDQDRSGLATVSKTMGVDNQQVQVDKSDQDRSGLATASKTMGVLSLFAWILPICGFPVAVAGLIMGALGKNSSKAAEARSGTIMSIIGLVLSIVNGIIGAIVLSG